MHALLVGGAALKVHKVLVGPPGSGKTRRLLAEVDAEVAASVLLDRLAVLTFTRAASLEVLSRLKVSHGIAAQEVPYVRTIHSAALRLLQPDGVCVLSDVDMVEFADRYDYHFSKSGEFDDDEGELTLPSMRTGDDLLRYVYEWGRNRRLDAMVALGRCPVSGVGVSRYTLFIKRYEAFKAEKRSLDFVDILERALQSGMRLPVDVGFVDEAQDLSPLQSALVEQFLCGCERVYVAGDDDQAIYQFQGGRADWFLGLAKSSPTEFLDHSHRLPACVKELADAIIHRNRERIPKEFSAGDREGSIEHASQALAIERIDANTSTFVLARNRIYLRPYADALVDRLVPFIVEGRGGRNPLGDPGLVVAFETAQRLREGADTVPAVRLREFFRHISHPELHLPREARDAVERAAKDGFTYRRDGLVNGLELGNFLEHLTTHGTSGLLRNMPRWKLRYLDGLWRALGEIPEPRVILTSIHASKGREADRVIVVPDMTPATAKSYASARGGAYESENRIAYVAVTRARSQLVLVEPRTSRRFNYPRTTRSRLAGVLS